MTRTTWVAAAAAFLSLALLAAFALPAADLSMATLDDTTLDNALTDAPMGTPMDELDPPVSEQLEAHVRFIESGGADGAPADFSGVDLRPLKLLAHLNLATLRASGATFYGIDL